MTNNDMSVQPDEQHCLTAGIIGAPNAGKSTLVNSLVGTKVSIVTHKVQTTRNRLRAVVIHDKSQLVLVDTPGIFSPKRTLERAIVQEAWHGIQEVDQLLMVYDATRPIGDEHRDILKRLQHYNIPTLLVLNKIDLIKNREMLLELSKALYDLYPFERSFMISAEKHEGVKDIIAYLAQQAPKHPWLFPGDQLSDMPMRFLAAEITREQLFIQLQEELPYALMVQTEQWQENAKGEYIIHQCVYVQRDSQKSIVLGKGGNRIKHVSTKARAEMKKAFDVTVHLYLHVKVKENWTERPHLYAEMGLDFPG